MNTQKYKLPALPYNYNDLEPYISEAQLTLHHDNHHKTYVTKANEVLEKLEKSREEGSEIDIKPALKTLSFSVGGHILHSLFWENLMPSKKAKEKCEGSLEKAINNEFGSLDRFKQEFSGAANTVEGSGWAALAYDKLSERLFIVQLEKHNLFLYPNSKIILVLDAWEHAYYLDYHSGKENFFNNFWNIINWSKVEERFEEDY